ncbi:MAG: hypothetical protein HY544_05110 [Candidatus Diapherotrites archaeon]|uniref:Transcription regulator TrmB N-terminal domain-containing protein n=1 Tax=Candidatus Iainarchaeum sp. TaxID=3101447 RepID=A0A8T3YMD0_9ARCH|nr:hypothetical protein [Candidatus Diapherotrites archaeon]
MIEATLERLGFSPSETKVYLHLLRSGSGYANSISAATHINRTNVYEALDRLIAKGAVSFVSKNKVKSFQAKPPEHLKVLVEEKEADVERTRRALLKDIIELKKSAPKVKESLEAGIFVGRKALKSIFEEMLDAGEPLSFLAANLQFRYFFGAYFWQWHKKRASLGIIQRTIFPESVRKDVKPPELWERKFVGNGYTSPTTTIVYGDNCLFIQWTKEPLAIKIENAGIARSHQNYFNALWKMAKE